MSELQSIMLDSLAARYWDFLRAEEPFTAVLAGEAVEGAVLFRESPADHDRRAAGARALLAELDAIAPPADLQARVTHAVMGRELRAILDFHALGAHLRPSLFPAGPDFNLVYFANTAQVSTTASAARYVERLAQIPAFLADLRSSLAAGHDKGFRYPRLVLTRAAEVVRGNLCQDPAESPFFGPFRRLGAAPAREIAVHADRARELIAGEIMPAFRAHAAYIGETLAADARDSIALRDDVQGEALYERLVRHYTTLDADARDMHALGLTEVGRLSAELRRIAAEAGFGDDLYAYRRWLQEAPQFRCESEPALLDRVRALCKRIDLELPRCFGRLPRITYGVKAIPAGFADSLPPAYAQPGPADCSAPGVFWVNAQPGKCPTYLHPSFALHEAWPGHLMHIALIQEMEHLPKFRRNGAVKYTACIEGWAMYCEVLGIEFGLYDTPHDHFGRLNMEMWRVVRLVVDTGIHALGWSREMAIAFMMANVAIPSDMVEGEIDRYIALPGQALAYQPGNLRFRDLRARAEARLGAGFDLRRYHDAVIAAGPLPLPLLDVVLDDWLKTAGAP